MKPVLKHRCMLGEGPLWTNGRLFWFDITAGRMLAWRPGDAEARSWTFGEPVSAAAPLEGGGLMIASASSLLRFDPDTGGCEMIVPLEADDARVRSNDGRADRQGGFWISTMGKAAEAGLGRIWRYFRGELRCLRKGLAIPNAICFSPDGTLAYFADTALATIWRWALDADGWPLGDPQPFLKVPEAEGGPDGAVVDREGCLWNARWGAGRIVRLAPEDGRVIETIRLSASRPSCPAFGGDNLATLYVTTAQEGMSSDELAAEADAGALFETPVRVPGLADTLVKLA
ncbi:MAG: SMP-30/gluconolactonase/LRE family protein [Novosphingobium sp.]|nr:SMP-30/gluconolactonase/LRE family protein [Novosphingobium sp.]